MTFQKKLYMMTICFIVMVIILFIYLMSIKSQIPLESPHLYYSEINENLDGKSLWLNYVKKSETQEIIGVELTDLNQDCDFLVSLNRYGDYFYDNREKYYSLKTNIDSISIYAYIYDPLLPVEEENTLYIELQYDGYYLQTQKTIGINEKTVDYTPYKEEITKESQKLAQMIIELYQQHQSEFKELLNKYPLA